MKVLHISWLKRSDGELGGVEKFADLLSLELRAQGHECRIISWSDYPGAKKANNLNNPDKALLLGAWAEAEIDFDIAVSDGYWGAGITAHPVAPVIHGTWAQFHVNMGNPSPLTHPEVQAQHRAFNAVNAFPIACSPASARELSYWHHRGAYATILHGVDARAFSPLKQGHYGALPVILHAATNDKKGRPLMPRLAADLAQDFQVTYLNAGRGEEAAAFQRGDVFFHPARHEGNAYALLEAMSTGLPIVTTPVGLFADIRDYTVGRVLPLDTTIAGWAAAVREVWGDGVLPYRRFAQHSRALAGRLASLEDFRVRWSATLQAILKGADSPCPPAAMAAWVLATCDQVAGPRSAINRS